MPMKMGKPLLLDLEKRQLALSIFVFKFGIFLGSRCDFFVVLWSPKTRVGVASTLKAYLHGA